MTDSLLLVDTVDGVRTIRINRPDKLNALNAATLDALDAAFSAAASDDAVRVVVLTGAGPKAFVAGADIAELKDLDTATARVQALKGQEVFNRIERMPKPVIAAVNGFALGGGCELALACHVRLASENARFGLPEVSLGIIPGYGGTQRLPRLVGKGVALDLILSGEMVGAADALRMGLVSRVLPQAELKAAAEKLAKTILSRGPLALRSALNAVHEGLEMPLGRGLEFEATQFGLLAASADMKEGMGAFLEKRPAQFKGI